MVHARWFVAGFLTLCASGCDAEAGAVTPGDAAVDAQVTDGALADPDAESEPVANADGCYGEQAFELSRSCEIYLIRATRESEDSCRFLLDTAVSDASYLLLKLDGRWLSHAGNWSISEMNSVIALLGDACATVQDGQEHFLTATMLCVCVERIDEQSR